jgi:hypothetical protein
MKKKIMIVCLLAALVLPGAWAQTQEYKPGDTGPAGGIIFYVREGASPGEW